MKKSTLITTIAMIVVVVVALSTATYAWFSSSATAVAGASFTTDASGDWTIMLGTWGSNGALSFVGNAADEITLPATAINGDLWCPTAAITTTIAGPDASTTASNLAGFVNATNNSGTYEIAKLQTVAYDSANTTADDGRPMPYALRLVNVSGATKQLQLNITLNARNNGTNNSMYGAAAVRFYIYEVTSFDTDGEDADQNPDGHTYTSGYGYATETAAVNGYNSIPDPAAAITKSVQPMTQVGETPADMITLVDYTVGDISSQFHTAGQGVYEASDALGIADGDKFVTYTFNLSNYPANAFSNIIIYAWIDGWTANASAARSTFDVKFGFVSGS